MEFDRLVSVLKEASLPKRIEMLEIIRDSGENGIEHSKLNELVKNGLGLPPSTFYRSLNNMFSLGLIRKDDDKIYLTPIGTLLIDAIQCINDLLEFEYLDIASAFVLTIPPEMRFGVRYIKECKKVDITETSRLVYDLIAGVEKGGKYIDRIIDPDLYALMLKKRKECATEKVISSVDTVIPRLNAEIEAAKKTNFDRDTIEELEEKLEIKVLDLPLQLGVIDERIGVIMFLKDKYFTPIFITEDKKAVRWMDSVFDYYWDMAEPLDKYLEGGMEGWKRRVVEAVS
ncbi:hypothetical protein Asulf_00310 [Archaeoglobus sulfaticallidus PM70-1]|uniref:Methanogenesis regulatory protein FilR1 middle domain-containing protein n=1 Tax=Archaeoglobus sulfaticallidus PM70-1 TaxID=387631 RepID=N0BDL7_9EURY|nr:hypothetical protein [Archaeoglobus sulfaticallidus]AGK60342.1 hypothetical protein Asulf_00310 [Archaeoglobus sulfaticallidus PM70-1]